MGDRVSISFKNGNVESPTLYSHWGGIAFVEDAREYAKRLPRNSHMSPLDRLEPDTVMVDFIRHITQGMGRVTSDLYIPRDPQHGDNSDNGHPVIDLM